MGFVRAFKLPKTLNKHPADGAPGRIIRGFAAHPFGASTALPYCSSARCAAVEPDLLIVSQVRMGFVRAFKLPKTLNKHPADGAPGRIIRGFAAHPFGASTALPYCSSARCAAVEPDLLIVSQVRRGFVRAFKLPKTLNKHPVYGAPGRIRTCDTRLRRPVLYPAELRARGA